MPAATMPNGSLQPPCEPTVAVTTGSVQVETSRDNRLPGLDLLRAVAISWVILYHASFFDLVPHGSRVVDFGWMGVDLFFVLSGFLIGGQLFRPLAIHNSFSLPRFYIRRAFRTLPAYAMVLAVYSQVPILRETDDIQPLWQFLTFTQNLLIHVTPAKAFSHAWSLCVEEQFYLAFPLIVACLALRPKRWKAVAALILAVAFGMALRGGVWLHSVGPHAVHGAPGKGYVKAYLERIYYPTWTRLDGFIFGTAAAALQTYYPKMWQSCIMRSNLLLVVGISGLVGSIFVFGNQFPGLLVTVIGYPVLAASLSLIVAASTSNRCLTGFRPIPGAKALATISYSLYLCHKLLFHWVQLQLQPKPQHLSLIVAFAGLISALAGGTALYWLVERTFLKLRDRLDGRSRVSLATTGNLLSNT